ncbi:hypothetical protein ABW21_db0203273 [Orbilia brochopaga]|nr:hypothetical protein ABW21_db0203273 [Drechslerella brochopaga]
MGNGLTLISYNYLDVNLEDSEIDSRSANNIQYPENRRSLSKKRSLAGKYKTQRGLEYHVSLTKHETKSPPISSSPMSSPNRVMTPRNLEERNNLGTIIRKSKCDDLVAVSKPPQLSMQEMGHVTFTPEGAGNGVAVYVVDSGCNMNHKEFEHQQDADWLFSGPFPHDEKAESLSPLDEVPPDFRPEIIHSAYAFHGSLMAAKIAGLETGVAPGSKLVIVNSNTGDGTSHQLSFLDCYLKIYDHMLQARASGKKHREVVINVSQGTIDSVVLDELDPAEADPYALHDTAFSQNYYFNIEREIISLLGKEGAYVVTSSGNASPPERSLYEPSSPMADFSIPITHDLFPAAHKYSVRGPDDLDKLVVVGGVSSDTGRNFDYSADFVKLYAPVDPMCAIELNVKNDQTAVSLMDGSTSSAAAIVSGLLATFIGLGFESPLKLLEERAYPRPPYTAPVVWNGFTQESFNKFTDHGRRMPPWHTYYAPQEYDPISLRKINPDLQG